MPHISALSLCAKLIKLLKLENIYPSKEKNVCAPLYGVIDPFYSEVFCPDFFCITYNKLCRTIQIIGK
jgi:hypothetical protein